MDLSGLYRDIVESSPDGLWVIDLDGRTGRKRAGAQPRQRSFATRSRCSMICQKDSGRETWLRR